MKTYIKKTVLISAFCILHSALFMSCMDGGYDETGFTTQAEYGNNNIEETHVVTIKELFGMDKYKETLRTNRAYKEVTEDIQLKVRVTGNDEGGNIYNKVALQDANGDAILVCVYAGGLHSYLPVGQEILINLKGLYVGNYGFQRQIGVPYTTTNGNIYAGRMPNWLWQQHFKLLGTPDPTAKNCQPITFTPDILKDIANYAGRLMTIKGVTLRQAGEPWAPSGDSVLEEESNNDFSVERAFSEISSDKIVVYTSTSAKFAREIIPEGKVKITGIFTRYGDKYQLQMRTIKDIQVVE